MVKWMKMIWAWKQPAQAQCNDNGQVNLVMIRPIWMDATDSHAFVSLKPQWKCAFGQWFRSLWQFLWYQLMLIHKMLWPLFEQLSLSAVRIIMSEIPLKTCSANSLFPLCFQSLTGLFSFHLISIFISFAVQSIRSKKKKKTHTQHRIIAWIMHRTSARQNVRPSERQEKEKKGAQLKGTSYNHSLKNRALNLLDYSRTQQLQYFCIFLLTTHNSQHANQ